jgi:hypothetical protein
MKKTDANAARVVMKIFEETHKPVCRINNLDMDKGKSLLGYSQIQSTTLHGFISFLPAKTTTRLTIKRVKIPDNFREYEKLHEFMKNLIDAGGKDMEILQCQLGDNNRTVTPIPEKADKKKMPYINITCSGPRMMWVFDEENASQFKMKVNSKPGNSTYNRDLLLFAGKLTPKTCLDMNSTLTLPFGIVIQGRKRTRDGEPKSEMYETILEIVLAPNKVAAIHMDWSPPPAEVMKNNEIYEHNNETERMVVLKTAEHKFPSKFVDEYLIGPAALSRLRDAKKVAIPKEDFSSDYYALMKQGDATLDIIQLAANHMCDFAWKSIGVHFKIQAYKNLTHVMWLELFRTSDPPVMDTDIRSLYAKYDSVDHATLMAQQPAKVDGSCEIKDLLFKATSALFHKEHGLFPFSHGQSKMLSFQQQIELLAELKTFVIFLNKTQIALRSQTENEPDYSLLFKEIDEAVDFAVTDPCETYYALKKKIEGIKSWSRSGDIGLTKLLKKEYLDPCSVWDLILPLKIEQLLIVPCLGMVRNYLKWVFDAGTGGGLPHDNAEDAGIWQSSSVEDPVKGYLPYDKAFFASRRLPMRIEDLDLRTNARRQARHKNAAVTYPLKDTWYMAIPIELQGCFLKMSGMRQQPRISSVICNPMHIDMNRRANTVVVDGMGDNVIKAEQVTRTIHPISRAASPPPVMSTNDNPYAYVQEEEDAPHYDEFKVYTRHGFFHMDRVAYNQLKLPKNLLSEDKFVEEYLDVLIAKVNKHHEARNLRRYQLPNTIMTYFLHNNDSYMDLADFFVMNITTLVQAETKCKVVLDELYRNTKHAVCSVCRCLASKGMQQMANDWIRDFEEFYTSNVKHIKESLRGDNINIDIPMSTTTLSEHTDILGSITAYDDSLVEIKSNTFRKINVVKSMEATISHNEFLGAIRTMLKTAFETLDGANAQKIIPFFFSMYLSINPDFGYSRKLEEAITQFSETNIMGIFNAIHMAVLFFRDFSNTKRKTHIQNYDTHFMNMRRELKTKFFEPYYTIFSNYMTHSITNIFYSFYEHDEIQIPILDNSTAQRSNQDILNDLSRLDHAAKLDKYDELMPELLKTTDYQKHFVEMIKHGDMMEDTEESASFRQCYTIYQDTIRRLDSMTGRKKRGFDQDEYEKTFKRVSRSIEMPDDITDDSLAPAPPQAAGTWVPEAPRAAADDEGGYSTG